MNLNNDDESLWVGRTYFIEGDPVPKGRPRLGRGGHVFTPQKTLQAELHIKKTLMLEKPIKILGPIKLILKFYMPRPKSVSIKSRPYHTVRCDLDNLCKLQLDASNGILWNDDSQIVQLECSKVYALNNEKTGTYITLMNPDF